jgi:hypothetical protein
MLARADGSSDGLPTKREASSLNTNTTKKEKKKSVFVDILSLCSYRISSLLPLQF